MISQLMHDMHLMVKIMRSLGYTKEMFNKLIVGQNHIEMKEEIIELMFDDTINNSVFNDLCIKFNMTRSSLLGKCRLISTGVQAEFYSLDNCLREHAISNGWNTVTNIKNCYREHCKLDDVLKHIPDGIEVKTPKNGRFTLNIDRV